MNKHRFDLKISVKKKALKIGNEHHSKKRKQNTKKKKKEKEEKEVYEHFVLSESDASHMGNETQLACLLTLEYIGIHSQISSSE